MHSDWTTYRRDNHLSAHCPVPGKITDPVIRWSIPIGGTLQNVFIVPAEVRVGATEFLLAYGGAVIRSTDDLRIWKTPPLGIHTINWIGDIDGDGRQEILASNGNEIFILSLDTGAVRWRYRFASPESFGIHGGTLRVHNFFPERADSQLIVPALHSRSVFIMEFSGGAENGRVLHALEMGDAFHPTVVIGDVDNDGEDELLVTRLGSVAVFDPRTGTCKMSSTWETDGTRRRGYGQIMLRDIDGDGRLELVILARQVTRHIAVLDNDGHGHFSPLWDRLIEHIYPTDHTDVRYCLNAICELDGKAHIVASIFDDRDDGRWRTELIDAKTGITTHEIDDVIIGDVWNHDGGVELLAMECTSRLPASIGVLKLISFERGTWKVKWSRDHSRFAYQTIGQTSSIGKYHPALFEHDAVWRDDHGFYVFDIGGSLIHIDATTFHETKIFDGDHSSFSMRSLLAAKSDRVVVISDAAGTLRVVGGGSGRKIACGRGFESDGHPVEHPSPTPAIFSTTDQRRFIAIPTSGDTVSLYECIGEAAPVLKWRVPGRGRIGFDTTHHSVSIGDINNDGEPEILFAIPGEHSALVAMSVDGKIIKRYDFPEWPSISAGTRTGCYEWLTFNDGEHLRLFVSGYGSESMNSEMSICLDAATGERLWKRERVGEEIEGVGFGAWGSASADGTTGYFCAKAFVCIFDLRTGELLQPVIQLTELTRNAMKAAGNYVEPTLATLVTKDDPFTAYGSVVLHDIDNDGALELVVTGCLGGFGVLRADGTPMWWKSAPLADLLYHLGGVCDVDGDGAFELGIGHSTGDFVCYDAITGIEKWRMNLGVTSIDCSSCDIDGDGRDEFICRTADGRIMAIGVDAFGAPIVKWEMKFEFGVGNVVIDEIGICAVVGDGSLVCIWQAPHPRSLRSHFPLHA